MESKHELVEESLVHKASERIMKNIEDTILLELKK
jgi:hypothetical protein